MTAHWQTVGARNSVAVSTTSQFSSTARRSTVRSLSKDREAESRCAVSVSFNQQLASTCKDVRQEFVPLLTPVNTMIFWSPSRFYEWSKKAPKHTKAGIKRVEFVSVQPHQLSSSFELAFIASIFGRHLTQLRSFPDLVKVVSEQFDSLSPRHRQALHTACVKQGERWTYDRGL
jgi:hypothetical protein